MAEPKLSSIYKSADGVTLYANELSSGARRRVDYQGHPITRRNKAQKKADKRRRQRERKGGL